MMYAVETEDQKIRMIQAGELEVMSAFARAHNRVCGNSLQRSDEDGKPYCRYNIDITESGIGQNYFLVCVECKLKLSCTEGYNS